ncbi:hypothetical protein DFH06DRAFT_1374258 [Mycena polygramma]|nr:hypothetical protein DFH06DRAFT_1374258 [Mycena polygramma]
MSIPLPWLQNSISDLPGALQVISLLHPPALSASGSSETLVNSSVVMFILPTLLPYPLFTDVLVSHGIIPSLMAYLETALQAPSTSDWHDGIGHCVGAISMYTAITPGYPWVVQALQGGILRHIIVLGGRILTATDKGIYLALKRLLCETFPGALLSYRVLRQMKQSIAEVETASNSPAFSRSALYGEWTAFRQLLKERTEVLDKWEADGRPSFLVCDNMKDRSTPLN